MSNPNTLQPDPSAIGGIDKAPYVLLPDAPHLFRLRAERFEALAPGSALSDYLRFLGELTRVQGALASELADPQPLPSSRLDLARANKMPLLDRNALAGSADFGETLHRFFDAAASLTMPKAAEEALHAVRSAEPVALERMIGNVLADAAPFESLAQHLFVAAGAQIHATMLAGTLDAHAVEPIGVGICPVCGGPPVASVVVGFVGAEGARYAVCSLCGTSWNEVRVKCLACGSTKGIGYREVESESDGAATVKAEVCDTCRSWVKILYQNLNSSLEAVADDVASLGLDLLMRDTEYRHAGFDPFLIGY